jgi:hypothetical protein
VAQYSVCTIADLELDYRINYPNIRSPEGWQKDDARAPGMLLGNCGPAFPEGRSSGFHTHLVSCLNLLANVCVICPDELPATVIAIVKKTFRFRDAFFATTAYAAILFPERNYDKRYKKVQRLLLL